MKIDKVLIKNFGPIARETIQLHGESLLISGENGVGKTTIADAINTCLTLGGERSKYNAGGQGEKTSRGDARNLASYLLGAQTHGLLRPGRQRGHVICSLRSEEHDAFQGWLHLGFVAEAQPSPAGDPTLVGDPLGFCMISDSSDFPEELFAWNAKDESDKRTYQKIFEANVKAHGLAQKIARSDQKGAHFRNAYRSAFQEDEPDENKAFARLAACMSTLSMKHACSSPQDFALSAIQIKVDTDATAKIRQASDEHAQSARLVAQVNALRETSGKTQDAAFAYLNVKAEEKALQSKLAQDDVQEASARAAKASQLVETLRHKTDQLSSDYETCRQRLESLDSLIESLDSEEIQARSADGGELLRQEREMLQAQLARARQAEREKASSWTKQKQEAITVCRQTGAIDGLGPLSAEAARGLESARCSEDARQSANALIQATLERASDLDARSLSSGARVARLKEEASDISSRISKLKTGSAGANLPGNIQTALEILGSELPACKPRPLCSSVTPKRGSDPAWVRAVEAKMGKARFCIVVDPGFEYEANKILRAHLDAFDVGPKPEIARNDQVSKASTDLPERSALELFESIDETAFAYLRAKIGRLQLCRNEAEYQSSPRGLTLDGRSSDPHDLGMISRDPRFQPVFGAGALAESLHALSKDLQRAQEQLAQAEALWKQHDMERSSAARLKEIFAQAFLLEDAQQAQTLCAQTQDRLDKVQAALDQAQEGSQSSLARLVDIQDRKADAKKQKKQQEDLARTLSGQMGSDRARLEAALSDSEDLEVELEALRSKQSHASMAALRWGALCSQDPEIAMAQALAMTRSQALSRLREVEALLPALLSSWRDLSSTHNQSPAIEPDLLCPDPTGLAIDPSIESAQSLLDQTSSVAQKCQARHNADLLEQLSRSEIELVNIFTNIVCSKAINAEIEVEDQIKALNLIFSRISFRGARFNLRRKANAKYTAMIESMKRIHKIAKEHPDQLIDWSKARPEDAQLFHEILELSKLDDEESRARMQARMHPVTQSVFDVVATSLSENGQPIDLYGLAGNQKKSGGERESALILLSCVIAASRCGALSSKGEERKSGIRVIELDEAFDKLSMEFTNELMVFIEDVLGMQVIAMTPALKAPSISLCFPLHLTVSPSGSPEKPFTARLSLNRIDRSTYKAIFHRKERSTVEQAAVDLVDSLDPMALMASMPDFNKNSLSQTSLAQAVSKAVACSNSEIDTPSHEIEASGTAVEGPGLGQSIEELS